MQLLKLLTEKGSDRGYFPDQARSLFIADTPTQEEPEKIEFVVEEV